MHEMLQFYPLFFFNVIGSLACVICVYHCIVTITVDWRRVK